MILSVIECESMMIGRIFVFIILLHNAFGSIIQNVKGENKCELSADLVAEIQAYQPVVNQIVEAAVNGKFSGNTWKG